MDPYLVSRRTVSKLVVALALLLTASVAGAQVITTNGAGATQAFQASLPLSPNLEVNLATGNLHFSLLTSRFARGERTPRHALWLCHDGRAVAAATDLSGLGLGVGWSCAVGGKLDFPASGFARLTAPDGDQRLLAQVTASTWRSEIGSELDLATQGSGWVATDPAQWTWQYDSAGLLTQINDASGNAYTIARSSGRPTSVTEPSGRYATFAYDAGGHLQSITDSYAESWSFSYDAQARVAAVVDPLYGSFALSYDARHRITSCVDFSGATWQFAYYDSGATLDRLKTAVDPLGHKWELAYTIGSSITTQLTDPASRVWTTTHDTVDPPALTSTQDPANHVWTWVPDTRRRILQVTSPGNRTWSASYDDAGNVLSRTDPLGHQRTWTYDALNNPESMSFGGHTEELHYDDPLHPTSLTSHVEPLNSTQSATATYAWYGPADGSPAGIWNGLLASITDGAGAVTRFEYDALGAYVAIHEGPLTATGRVEQRWDSPGEPHFVDHGVMPPASGVPALPAPPSPLTGRLALDGSGSLAWFGGGEGEAWDLGVPIGPGAPVASTQTRSHAHDEFGRPTVLTLTTDEPFEHLAPPQPSPAVLTVSASRDDVSSGQPEVVQLVGGVALTLTRSSAGRLLTVSTGGTVTPGLQETLAHDADGRLTSVLHKDGSSSTWTYYDNGLVDTLTHSDGTSAVLSLDYDYDTRDLPQTRTATSASQSVVTTWEYDFAGRLTKEKRIANGGTPSEQRWTYDAAGNRRTLQRYLGGVLQTADTYNYDYDAPAVHGTHNNRLVSVEHRASNRVLLSTLYLLYDNPFGHVSRQVRKDVGSTTIHSTVFEYATDGSLWLAWDETWTDTAGGPTNLVRANAIETRQLEGSAHLWRRLDASTFFPSGSSEWTLELDGVRATYHVANNGTASFAGLDFLGQHVAANGASTYALPDLVGSASLVGAGGVFASQEFDAWGQPLSVPATLPTGGYCGALGVRQAFGGTALSDSGAIAMGRRWYSPELGRFLMRDPISVCGGVNVYAYASDQPTFRVDPLGLAPHGGVYPAPGGVEGPYVRPFRSSSLPRPPAPPVYGPIPPLIKRPDVELTPDNWLGPVLPRPGDPDFIGPVLPPVP